MAVNPELNKLLFAAHKAYLNVTETHFYAHNQYGFPTLMSFEEWAHADPKHDAIVAAWKKFEKKYSVVVCIRRGMAILDELVVSKFADRLEAEAMIEHAHLDHHFIHIIDSINDLFGKGVVCSVEMRILK